MVPRIQMKKNRQMQIFRISQSTPSSGSKPNGPSQPPRNRMEVIALMRIMLAYSPRKNSPKLMAEYSTKNPATISDSPSARSNGERLVSASVEMKKTMNIGNSGMQNQTVRCASTTSVRFRLPTQSSTLTSTKPMETS